ncbi:MAG TPA: hypothetical protein VEB66_02300 [Opitutaceae bacterium]|nr:hypothetical protein [Opitutaceae bacterium]
MVERVQILNANGDVENLIVLDTARFPVASWPKADGQTVRKETTENRYAKRSEDQQK